MAASASLSSTFSLYTPQSFALSSSRPSKHLLPIQNTANRHLNPPRIPISISAFYSYPIFNSYRSNVGWRITNDGFREDKCSLFKHYVSAQQDNQPDQANNEDRPGLDEFQSTEHAADGKYPSSLKFLMQAYKEASLGGDKKTTYEIEDMILVMEKEKNELAQKVSALSAEIYPRKEKCIRLQADFDNYRKRSEKEKLSVRNDAQRNVIESLLPMVDSFERAKHQIRLDTEREKKIDASYQGIYKQFVEIMRSLRVAAVPTVGKPFDPSMHEAVGREESAEIKEGMIIQEVRRGFFLGERLIRPAMVKVSSGPGKRKPPPTPEQSSEKPASVAGVDNR